MGFSKKNNAPEIAIVAHHRWHPAAEFIFHFPKRMPQPALDADARFAGLKDEEREREGRRALVETVAQMVSREPEGFDDFPVGGERLLAERFSEYFDDESQPELEAILLYVWGAYRAAALPVAYLKSSPDSGAAHALLPEGAL